MRTSFPLSIPFFLPRDKKFSKLLAKHRSARSADRHLASTSGYLTGALTSDTPPLSSLAGFHSQSQARAYGKSVDEVGRRGQSVSTLLGAWMAAGQKQEEARSGDAEIRKMEKQLEEVGISKEVQRKLGDKKDESVARHLVREGVEVKEEMAGPGPAVEQGRKSFEKEVDGEVEEGTASERRRGLQGLGEVVGGKN